MRLDEQVGYTINLPQWFGNSIRARLTRFYYELTGQLEVPAAPIPEDEAFSNAFATLPRKDKALVVEWLRNSYCRVSGLDCMLVRVD